MQAPPGQTGGYMGVKSGAVRGFTLIELLIVLTMMSILTAGVVLAFRGRQESCALSSSAKDLAAALRLAGNISRLKGLAHRVKLDSALNGFRVERVTGEGSSDCTAVSGRAGITRRMPESVHISAVSVDGCPLNPLPESLRFEPDGGGFCGVVSLRNRLGETLSVEVIKGTGQVRVFERETHN